MYVCVYIYNIIYCIVYTQFYSNNNNMQLCTALNQRGGWTHGCRLGDRAPANETSAWWALPRASFRATVGATGSSLRATKVDFGWGGIPSRPTIGQHGYGLEFPAPGSQHPFLSYVKIFLVSRKQWLGGGAGWRPYQVIKLRGNSCPLLDVRSNS